MSARRAFEGLIVAAFALAALPAVGADHGLDAGAATAAEWTLTVTRAGSGGGTVTTFGNVIDCGTTCSANYPSGARVTLAASTAGFSNSQFHGWLGACSGLDSCTVTINGPTQVSATFGTFTGSHRLDIDGSGGPVDALTDGLLMLRYLFGIRGDALTARVVAPGAPRSTVNAITGYLDNMRPALDVDGNGDADPLTDGMMILRYLFGLRGASLVGNATAPNARRNAAAIERQIGDLTPNSQQAQFIVYKTGLGSGYLSRNPGIDCGLDCMELFPRAMPGSGTDVMVIATAEPNSMLNLGLGDCQMVNSNTCTTKVDSDRMVPIRFDARSWLLGVNTQGPGVVVSTPASIDCGSRCVSAFPRESNIILTPVPAATARFTGWTGACGGYTGVCMFPLFADTSVAATFVTNPALTVTRDGSGTGAVSSEPNGIKCGSICVGYFNPGVKVTLSASADRGSTFGGWSGSCSGTGSCVITMDESKAQRTVNANFTLDGS